MSMMRGMRPGGPAVAIATWSTRVLCGADADAHQRKWRRIVNSATHHDFTLLQEVRGTVEEMRMCAERIRATHTVAASACEDGTAGGVVILVKLG